MTVVTYTKSGNKATASAKLPKAVFEIEVKNHELLKVAYLGYLAKGRAVTAITKKRGEVSGGGRKPHRQKGTGRARVGSSRNPLWRGGGVAFGPTGDENYNLKLSKKSKQQALRQALSLAAKEDRIKVIETFDCPDGRVKPTIELLSKISADGTVLLVVSQKDELVERATRNLPGVKAVAANYLTVYDILNADNIVISQKAVTVIDEWLSPNSKVKASQETKDE